MSKRKNKIYDIDFKQSSAKLALEAERPIAETARALGINENTLHGWVRNMELSRKICKKFKSRKWNKKNIQLRKENARLKQERDILKKATAYFASEIA